MTRRAILALALPSIAPSQTPLTPLLIEVYNIIDARGKTNPILLSNYWSRIWPEAVADFARCGIQLRSSSGPGEIRRSPAGRPIFVGLRPGVINVILTEQIPMHWDAGRGIAGIATRSDGNHLCLLALNHAHRHLIPLVSVNTCVHELLHVLTQDTLETRPKGWTGEFREFRIDVLATQLRFGGCPEIRQATQRFLATH